MCGLFSSLRKRLDSWLERTSLVGSTGHSMMSSGHMTPENWQKFAWDYLSLKQIIIRKIIKMNLMVCICFSNHIRLLIF